MRKIVLTALLTFTLLPALSFAQVYVKVAPPPPVVERYGAPPQAGFIWIPGYQRWNGTRYIWVAGHWVVRLVRAQFGFRMPGSIAAAAGSWLKATGGKFCRSAI